MNEQAGGTDNAGKVEDRVSVEQQLAMEEYKDVSANLRHYSNMQFAQMTICMAVIATVLFKIIGDKALQGGLRIAVLVAGIVLTGAFLIMSRRVSVYWDKFVKRACELEEVLGFSQYKRKPECPCISLNNRTAVAIVYWVILVLLFFVLCHSPFGERQMPSADSAGGQGRRGQEYSAGRDERPVNRARRPPRPPRLNRRTWR